MKSGAVAGAIVQEAFSRGLVIETSGANDEIVKCLTPLTITNAELEKGLDILAAAVRVVAKDLDKAAA
jgi:diaminobutyrate-2-oxoglutarate transaminase